MARTHHPNRHNYDSHPYWRYQWWAKHGPKWVRQMLERQFRRRTKQALHHGTEPPLRPADPKWIWW